MPKKSESKVKTKEKSKLKTKTKTKRTRQDTNVKNSKKKIQLSNEESEGEEEWNWKVVKSTSKKKNSEKSKKKETQKEIWKKKSKTKEKNRSKTDPKEEKKKKEKEELEKAMKKSSKILWKKEYVKGKQNLRVSLILKSNIFDSKDNSLIKGCCVKCNNLNVIRAIKTNNKKLLNECISSRNSISSLFQNESKEISKCALDYAILNFNKEQISQLLNNFIAESKYDITREPRCQPKRIRLSLTDTGENSEFMVGVRVRKLNTTRGNKMGNNAFIFDDSEISSSAYQMSSKIVDNVLMYCKDPTMIDFLRSYTLSPSLDSSVRFNFDFESNIYKAIRKGNFSIAKFLIGKTEGNNLYGFNQWHIDVLKKKASSISIKVKTSLTKKPITNLGISPMHLACINPDASIIEKLVEWGGDWNCLDNENRKPIHYAAVCESEGPLNYLISIGALIDEGDKHKATPLMLAADANRKKNVEILLKKGANPWLKDRLIRNTPFHIACENGHLDIVKIFIKDVNFKIDRPGRDGMTGLILASLKGHMEVVEYLVGEGAKVTKRDKFKRTSLVNAIRTGQTSIVSYWLSEGSEYDFPDSSKNTPMHYACAYGWFDIVELLLKAGANPISENDWKVTPMEIAFLKNHFRIVKYLLDSNLCDVNTSFNLGMRLLHYSFRQITMESLEEMKYFIIDKKADINIQNFDGKSALHYLAEFNFAKYNTDNPEVISDKDNLSSEERMKIKREKHEDLLRKVFNLLKMQDIQTDLITKEGKTALQIALENANTPFIEMIMEMKPKLTFQDAKGNTIFHLLVPLFFGETDEMMELSMKFLSVIKTNLNKDEIENIIQSFDNLGFTPIWKFMFEYSTKIWSKFDSIHSKETYIMKKEKYEKQEKIEKKKEKNENDEDDESANEDDENENVDEDEDNAPKIFSGKKMIAKKPKKTKVPRSLKFPAINPIGSYGGFGSRFNQVESLETKINKIVLSIKESEEAHKKSIIQFHKYIDKLLSVFKTFINWGANPHKKVAKLNEYRMNIIKENSREDIKDKSKHQPYANAIGNTVKQEKKVNGIERQYHEKNGKFTLWMYLMTYPYQPMLKYFLEILKWNVNELNIYKENALFSLIHGISSVRHIHYDSAMLKDTWHELLLQLINITQIDWKGNTAFYWMSKTLNVPLMEILYANGADANQCNKSNQNALRHFVDSKNTNFVKTLVEKFKVDINYQDNRKRTCMHYLFNNEIETTNMDESLTDYLLSLNPKINTRDISGRTPLHYLFVKLNDEYNTTQIDPISSLSKLLELEGIEVDPADIYGNTPWHYAVQRGSTISLLTLVRNKVDVNKKNAENNTALGIALMYNQPNIAISLMQEQTDINDKAHMWMKRDEQDIINRIKKNLEKKQNMKEAKKLSSTNATKMVEKNNGSKNDWNVYNSDNEEISDEDEDKKSNVDMKMNVDDDKECTDNDKSEEESNESEESEYNDDYSDDLSDETDNNNNNNNTFGNMNSVRNTNQGFRGFGNNYYNNNNRIGTSWANQNNYNTGIRNNTYNNSFNFNPNNYNNYGNNNNNNNNKSTANLYWELNNKYFKNQYEKDNGVTLFRICIVNEFQGITFLFLANGYELAKAIEDSFYESKFHLAMKLLNKSPKDSLYNKLNENNQNLFHVLGRIGKSSNDIQLIQFFEKWYSKHIPLLAKDNEGNSPLHYAAFNHFDSFCRFIVNKEGQKVLNEINYLGLTPFIMAIKSETNLLSLSEQLLNSIYTWDKTEVLYENTEYNEPYYKITAFIHVVRTLIKYEDTINPNDNNHIVMKVFNKMIMMDGKLNEVDSTGKDSLMYCVIDNNFELLKILIQKSKKESLIRNQRDNLGKTLVSYCISINELGSYENEKMLRYWIKNNFDYSTPDNNNKTPIDYAKIQKSGNNINILKQIVNIQDLSMPIETEESDALLFDTCVNYEKDTEELFIQKKKEAPDQKRKKIPNLRDYKGQSYELYKDDTFGYWDASLTKVNIQNGIYGEYMFYFIQLVHDWAKELYIVTTQFGRIGEEGANQRSPFNNLEEAKEDFKKVFKSKTGTLWENKEQFERQKGKYMLLQFNDVQLTHKEWLKPFDYIHCPPTNIKNEAVKSLLQAFTDASLYQKAWSSSGINMSFFNFSMLNRELLIKAKEIILDINKLLNELEGIKSKTKSNFNSMLSPSQIDKVTEVWSQIYKLSSRYYELIPHQKYATSAIQPLDRWDDVRREMAMLDDWVYIERAISIFLGAQYRSKEVNPLDYIYNAIQTNINLLSPGSEEFSLLEKYMRSSSPFIKIENIFKIRRKGEAETIEKWMDTPNHYLLFHGTKNINFLGIFSSGLRISPVEASTTGYLFGKGLYFSDMYCKSTQYCNSLYMKDKKKNFTFILICEVVVGNPYSDVLNVGLDGNLKTDFEYDSYKAKSYQGPDWNKTFITVDNFKVPLGKKIEYLPRTYKTKIGETIVELPEYVVYDTSQVRIKYLAQIEG